MGDDRLLELELALEEISWGVLGLAEIRRNYEGLQELKSGNLFLHTSAKKSNFGTGFLVNKELINNIVEFKGISERSARLTIKQCNQIYNIIQVHAPTSRHEQKIIDDFYDEIKNEINEIRQWGSSMDNR